jgi:hypothetical protein
MNSSALPPMDLPPMIGKPEPSSLRHRSDGELAGVILIAIGAIALIGQVEPNVGKYIPLGIGLAILGVFALRRHYGALVAGCILTGIGAGVVLASAYPDQTGGGLMLLSMAAGFAAIWLIATLMRLRETRWWPLVPAAILGSIGGLVAVDADESLYAIVWPIALIAAGLVVLLAGLRSRA